MTTEADRHLLSITLTVNGQAVEAQDASDLTLQELLHTRLGWRDVRYGCGEGICGACVILLDGAPRALRWLHSLTELRSRLPQGWRRTATRPTRRLP